LCIAVREAQEEVTNDLRERINRVAVTNRVVRMGRYCNQKREMSKAKALRRASQVSLRGSGLLDYNSYACNPAMTARQPPKFVFLPSFEIKICLRTDCGEEARLAPSLV
jgi:hypothetical protein